MFYLHQPNAKLFRHEMVSVANVVYGAITCNATQRWSTSILYSSRGNFVSLLFATLLMLCRLCCTNYDAGIARYNIFPDDRTGPDRTGSAAVLQPGNNTTESTRHWCACCCWPAWPQHRLRMVCAVHIVRNWGKLTFAKQTLLSFAESF